MLKLYVERLKTFNTGCVLRVVGTAVVDIGDEPELQAKDAGIVDPPNSNLEKVK